MNSEIILLLDQSGCFQSLNPQVIAGFNGMLEAQQAIKTPARLTTIFYDSILLPARHDHVDLQNAHPLVKINLAPPQRCATLDAIYDTVSTQAARIDKEGWADKVAMYVVSDGFENESDNNALDCIQALKAALDTPKVKWAIEFLSGEMHTQEMLREIANGVQGVGLFNFQPTCEGVPRLFQHLNAHITHERQA